MRQRRAHWQTVSGASPLLDRRRREPATFGNTEAREGCDRCYCGCKYWKSDACIDCGTRIAECLADPEWVADNRKEFVNPA